MYFFTNDRLKVWIKMWPWRVLIRVMVSLKKAGNNFICKGIFTEAAIQRDDLHVYWLIKHGLLLKLHICVYVLCLYTKIYSELSVAYMCLPPYLYGTAERKRNIEKQVRNLSTACVVPFNLAPNWKQMNIKGTSYLLVGTELTKGILKYTVSACFQCVLSLLTYIYKSQI